MPTTTRDHSHTTRAQLTTALNFCNPRREKVYVADEMVLFTLDGFTISCRSYGRILISFCYALRRQTRFRNYADSSSVTTVSAAMLL